MKSTEVLVMFATLVGGLAFFLYGMNAMSSGLEQMAGGKLETTLKKGYKERFSELFPGRRYHHCHTVVLRYDCYACRSCKLRYYELCGHFQYDNGLARRHNAYGVAVDAQRHFFGR